MSKTVMSKEDVSKLVHKIATSVLLGEGLDDDLEQEGDYARLEDIDEALDSFNRKLAEKLSSIPDDMPFDFETRETARQVIDALIADHVKNINASMELLRSRAVPE